MMPNMLSLAAAWAYGFSLPWKAGARAVRTAQASFQTSAPMAVTHGPHGLRKG